MSYQSTNNIAKCMRYLQQYRYAGLPAVLFDRYLWFYAELEEIQHGMVYGLYNQRPAWLYENISENFTSSGIACLFTKEQQLTILLDAGDDNGIADFFHQLSGERPGEKATIIVPCQQLAESISSVLGWENTPGAVKYYADTVPAGSTSAARELFEDDEHYLESIQPRYWPGYRAMISTGYRFFGIMEDERLISMCGLVPLTLFHGEIIGVETFSPQDRCKGYARKVCSLALREGLKDYSVISWSTNLKNVASCKTAQSLGFKLMFNLFSLTGAF